MDNTIKVALITGLFGLLGTLATLIPVIVSNRKKTQDALIEQTNKSLEQISSMEKKLDAHIKEDEWNTAKMYRAQILRFNDELYLGIKHSKENFDQIIDTIDDYEKFCSAHPDFKNNKGKSAMENILNTYKVCETEHLFLTR